MLHVPAFEMRKIVTMRIKEGCFIKCMLSQFPEIKYIAHFQILSNQFH